MLTGSNYPSLATSLLAQDSLLVQKVEDALKNKAQHQSGAAAAAARMAAVSFASPSFPSSSPSSSTPCPFCKAGPHPLDMCFCFKKAAEKAQQEVEEKKTSRRPKQRARAAREAESPTEDAGAASLRPSTFPDALTDAWNADTGATSHMTPRRDVFINYKPSSVLIRVANGAIVRAAGIGTVKFAPVKDDGVKLRSVRLSNVLHVPSLNQSLLSVLTLTIKHRFWVVIESKTMDFIQDGVLRFQATVGANHVALLSGSTVVQSQRASAASEASLYELWHKRLGHIGYDRFKLLLSKQLASNAPSLHLPPHSSLPVCPCLDGKMTRDSFPSSTTVYSSPLQLVHSDLHGPLPVTVNNSSTGSRLWTPTRATELSTFSIRRMKRSLPSSSSRPGLRSRLASL